MTVSADYIREKFFDGKKGDRINGLWRPALMPVDFNFSQARKSDGVKIKYFVELSDSGTGGDITAVGDGCGVVYVRVMK